MSRKEMIEQELEQFLYAEKSEVSRLSATVDALISEFRENKQQMLQLSLDLAHETGKFTNAIEQLSSVLESMQFQIKQLIEAGLKRSIIMEWIRSSPKFLSVIFGFTSFLGIFFTTGAHKDFLHYLLSMEKAKYAAHAEIHPELLKS